MITKAIDLVAPCDAHTQTRAHFSTSTPISLSSRVWFWRAMSTHRGFFFSTSPWW